MRAFFAPAVEKFKIDKKMIMLYVVIYLLWGTGMNYLGTYFEIARFTWWWQIITCYGLYLVPVSILLRALPLHAQYAYGLVAMGFLEFGGYALRTSYAYPGNILDRVFSPQNFSLGMALFFALYVPLGNWLIEKIYTMLFKRKPDRIIDETSV